MKNNPLRSIQSLASLLTAALAGTMAQAQVDELWVVESGPRRVSVIDTVAEQVIAHVALPGAAGSAAPHDICASTVGSGATAAHVFVTQGKDLHVIETATRVVVRTIDFEALFGRRLRLVGCDAAPAAQFQTLGSTPVRHHLFLSALAQVSGTATDEPWFLVVDQDRLLPGASGNPIVGDGALVPAAVPPADRGTPFDVAAVAAPWGPLQQQRAWFTLKRGGTAPTLEAVLVAKGANLSDPWLVVRRRSSPIAAGSTVGNARVGTPRDRNLPVIPQPDLGRLLNGDTGGRCDIGGHPEYVSVAGPAAGALQIWSLDRRAKRLTRTNESTCDRESFPVGNDAVSVSRDDTGSFGTTFVVNRGDDTLTVIRPNSTVGVIPLGPPPSLGCSICPEASISTTGPSVTACAISNFLVQTLDVNNDNIIDDRLSWTATGCQRVRIWCRCVGESALDGDCPCYCAPNDPSCVSSVPPAQGPSSTQNLHMLPPLPWKPLGYAPNSPYDILGAGPFDLEYMATP